MPNEDVSGKRISPGEREGTLREEKQPEQKPSGGGKNRFIWIIYVLVAAIVLVAIYFVSRQNSQTYKIFK
jgi:hypothetical protein